MGKRDTRVAFVNPVAAARASGPQQVSGPSLKDYLNRPRPSWDEVKGMIKENRQKKGSRTLEEYENKLNKQYRQELDRGREKLMQDKKQKKHKRKLSRSSSSSSTTSTSPSSDTSSEEKGKRNKKKKKKKHHLNKKKSKSKKDRQTHSDSDDEWEEVEVIVVGCTGVGKSSLIKSYCEKKCPKVHRPTVGIDYGYKKCEIGNREVHVTFWDMAGGDQYKLIRKDLYENTDICLIVYDVSDRSTFEKVGEFFKEFKLHAGKYGIMALVANKTDLDSKVSDSDVEKWTKGCQLRLFEVSASKSAGIFHVLNILLEEVA